MSGHTVMAKSEQRPDERLREQLLARVPLTQRRLELEGVSTALLEGGEGAPMILLHGQGAWAGMWMPIIPGLLSSHRVIVPDLPGLGASTTAGGPPGRDLVLGWLDELIEQTSPSPPTLVGISLGGSIAARFAARYPDRLSSLVLVDAGGLAGRVKPQPAVLVSLIRQSARPTERNTVRLLSRLTVDLPAVTRRLGPAWGPFVGYMTELARTPSVGQANRRLLRELGLPAIPSEELTGIRVPTSLIWGRQDPVMPLKGAKAASGRYGWPLHVIEEAGHLCHLDQPQAFLGALMESLHGAEE